MIRRAIVDANNQCEMGVAFHNKKDKIICMRDQEVKGAGKLSRREAGLWCSLGICVGVIICLLWQAQKGPENVVWGQVRPMVGARGIFALTGQLTSNSYGLFMVDVDTGSVWVYQYLPSTRRLRLVAARSFMYDRHLEDYNSDNPSPAEVAQWVQRARQAEIGKEQAEQEPPENEEVGEIEQ
jgi:hypothetical protein